ncbi:MAG: 50S ribosomal protein L23 [Patescibacteria group bacterium]
MKKNATIDVAAEPVVKKVRAPRAKKATTVETSTAAPLRTVSRFATNTILAPLVTEKTAKLSSANVMVFRVALSATRVAIKQAMKELYNVTPVKVNVITVRPRAVRFGGVQGTTKSYKKALVTLPKGTTIDVFASV